MIASIDPLHKQTKSKQMASGILGLKKTGVAIGGDSHATHVYTEAEKIAYVEYLNSTLDPSVPGLPIELEGEAIFSAFSKGVIFPCVIFPPKN